MGSLKIRFGHVQSKSHCLAFLHSCRNVKGSAYSSTLKSVTMRQEVLATSHCYGILNNSMTMQNESDFV